MKQKKFVTNYIKEIAELLDFTYGSPNHNNKKNPLDELVFILLSRRTRSTGYESAYNNLRKKYPKWKDVARAPDNKLLEIIGKAGLGSKRVRELKDDLEIIHERFGRYSLNRLKKWGNPKVFDFLTSLKGIGSKSAYCIMLYSLNRKVFPVDTHVNTICQRLGIIKLDPDHKKAQVLLADAFPKNLRYSLHVNMVAHGKEVCRSQRPSCKRCVISGFCTINRKNSLEQNGNPGFIDLFAGPGGMSLGFERAGFHLKAAVEYDNHAAATFLYNRPSFPPERVFNKPIEQISHREFNGWDIKVIVAGPPCQEYSPVRKKGYGELGRKKLYLKVLRFVRQLKPKYVLIENVPGMATPVNSKYVKRVKDGLIRHGYMVKLELLNAKDFGIPQSRSRLFFLARKVQHNSSEAAQRALDRIWKRIRSQKKEKKVGFLQGVSGLPKLSAGEGSDLLKKTSRGRISDYARLLESRNGIIFNHIARKHNPRDLEAFSIMTDGENAIDLYRKRPDLMIYSTDNFHTKYFKIPRNSPSPTIVSHLKKDANSFIHPIDNRGITPREAARLQSFPDNYRFLGNYGIQFLQIGNAVPPLLAEKIARAIMEEMYPNHSFKRKVGKSGRKRKRRTG